MKSKLDYRIESKINTHILGGVLLIFVGLFAILFPIFVSWVVMYFLGFVLLFSGIFFGFTYFSSSGNKKAQIVESVVSIFLGFVALFSPSTGLKILTGILFVFFLFSALTNFLLAWSIREQMGEILAILTGILSILLDLFILLEWNIISQILIGLFLGLILLMDGAVFVLQGMKIKKM